MHYFCMSNWYIALLLVAIPAFAQERPTAYQAMRTVGTQLKRDYVNHVIAVTGTNGNPQPETWKILIDDPGARGGVREIEVSNGRIASESSLGPVVDTSKLNLDSSGAFTLAQQTASKSHITFDTVDYTLRVDERGNPIWRVALQKQNGEPAGTIFIGSNHGTVTRTEGLFAGGDKTATADAQNGEQDSRDADDEDDDGDSESVTGRIKHAFHQVSDDVKHTFVKVRRSFVDFFEDK
jgi:hypothetical protein